MMQKVSIRSQIAAVKSAIKAPPLTVGEKRLRKQHLEAAQRTLEYLDHHAAEFKEFMRRAKTRGAAP